MTTIAIRDGIIATDSLLSQGDTKAGFIQKLWHTKIGVMAGAGSPMEVRMLYHWAFDWIDENNPPSPFSNGQGYVLTYKGTLYVIDEGKPFRLLTPYAAIGNGADLAIGAMAAGASAVRAVEIAIEHDNFSGGEIQWWNVKAHTGRMFDDIYR